MYIYIIESKSRAKNVQSYSHARNIESERYPQDRLSQERSMDRFASALNRQRNVVERSAAVRIELTGCRSSAFRQNPRRILTQCLRIEPEVGSSRPACLCDSRKTERSIWSRRAILFCSTGLTQRQTYVMGSRKAVLICA